MQNGAESDPHDDHFSTDMARGAYRMSHAGDREPGASLGVLDATMIGIGAMIGAGIFVLTGLAAETAGPAALIVFGLDEEVMNLLRS